MADKVILMDTGRIKAAGIPREILTDEALLQGAGLVPPLPVSICRRLEEQGIRMERCPLTKEELVEELCR